MLIPIFAIDINEDKFDNLVLI